MTTLSFIFRTCAAIGVLFDDPTFTQRMFPAEAMTIECVLVKKKEKVYMCQQTVEMKDGGVQRSPEEHFKIMQPGRMVNATLGQEIVWRDNRAAYAFKFADLSAPTVRFCSGSMASSQ